MKTELNTKFDGILKDLQVKNNLSDTWLDKLSDLKEFILEAQYQAYKLATTAKTVVFKDGTFIKVEDGVTWEYENDANWLATV